MPPAPPCTETCVAAEAKALAVACVGDQGGADGTHQHTEGATVSPELQLGCMP
jgi:hypothetical protein